MVDVFVFEVPLWALPRSRVFSDAVVESFQHDRLSIWLGPGVVLAGLVVLEAVAVMGKASSSQQAHQDHGVPMEYARAELNMDRTMGCRRIRSSYLQLAVPLVELAIVVQLYLDFPSYTAVNLWEVHLG